VTISLSEVMLYIWVVSSRTSTWCIPTHMFIFSSLFRLVFMIWWHERVAVISP
jgi:hypothetical protein